MDKVVSISEIFEFVDSKVMITAMLNQQHQPFRVHLDRLNFSSGRAEQFLTNFAHLFACSYVSHSKEANRN
jgi:hypothetical protein